MTLTLFVFLLLFIILASCTTNVDQDSYSISPDDGKEMSSRSKKHQKKASRIYFNDYPYTHGDDLLDEDDQASNIDPSIRLLLDSTSSLCEAKMIKSFQDQIEKKIDFPNCRNSNYCNSPLKKSKGRDHFCTDCYRYYLNTLKLRKNDSPSLKSLPKMSKNATSAANATTTMVTRSKSGKRAIKQKSDHSSTIDGDSFDDQNKDQPKKGKKKAKKQSKDDNTDTNKRNKKNKKALSTKKSTIKGKNSSSNKNDNVNALEKDTKIIAEIFKKFKKDLASNASPFECLNIYCKNRVSNADARKKNRICTSCYSYYMRTRQLNGKKKGIEYKFRLSSDGSSSLKVQKDKKTKDMAEHLRKEKNNKTLKNKRQAENDDENEEEERRSTDGHEKDNDRYDNFHSENEDYSLSKDEHYSDKETTAKEESFHSPHSNDDDYHYYYQDSPRDDNIYNDEKDDSEEDDKGKDSITSPLPQEEIEKSQPEKKTIVTMLNEFKNYIAMTFRGSKCRNLLCNNELGRNDDCVCQDCYTHYLNFGKLREDEDEDDKEEK